MTVIELLDAMEARIAALQADRLKLRSALDDAERRLQAVPRPARRKKKPAAKRKRKAAPAKAPEPAIAAPAPEVRSTGKRQALGRGLAQLRGLPRNGE